RKRWKRSSPGQDRIDRIDGDDSIALKVRRAKTDPHRLPHDVEVLESRPEAEDLIGIYAALAGIAPADALKQFAGAQFSTFKDGLAELVVAKLGPINAEMRRLNADPGYVDSVLAEGSARAQAIATDTMKAVKDIVGFVRR